MWRVEVERTPRRRCTERGEPFDANRRHHPAISIRTISQFTTRAATDYRSCSPPNGGPTALRGRPARSSVESKEVTEMMIDAEHETDMRAQAVKRLKKQGDFRTHLLVYCW